MVTDFTKEDIPVLGRLVSISEDNTIANAELIWDAKKGLNIQDTVDDINAEIVQLKQSDGLSQEYKNILNWLFSNTNLSYTSTVCNIDRDIIINYTDTRNRLALPPAPALTIESERRALDVSGYSDFNGNVNFHEMVYFKNGVSIYPENLSYDEPYREALSVTGTSVFNTVGRPALAQDEEYLFRVYMPALFAEDVKFKQSIDALVINVSLTILLPDDDSYISLYDLSNIYFANIDKTLDDVLLETSYRSLYYMLTYGQPVDIDEVTEVINNGGQIFLLIDSSSENTQIGLTRHSLGVPGIRVLLFVNSGADDDCFIHNIICWAEDLSETNNGWYESEYYVNPDHEWIEEELAGKQETLVSGENIKTVNGQSLLGSGNISITGGGGNGNVVDDDYVHTDNNFTNAEKSKLAGIAAGAEVNVQADWGESNSSSDAYINNKPTDLGDFTNNAHYLKQGDIVAGNITSTDIQNWNDKADAATTLSGYNILYDNTVFEEDENDVFTLNAQYKADHPVRMTSGDNQWTTDGDNKVPTVAAVYNKFLTNDDSTVVKTTGNQTISGTKTFSSTPTVTGVRASGSDLGGNSNASGEKLFATNGTITTLKTVNGNSLFGTGDIPVANSNFTAPTNNVAGTAGLVPAPAAGTQNYILGATGWVNPSLLIEDDVTVIITPTDANIRMIMTLAANMSETIYNAAYRLNTSGFTFTIDGQQYSYNLISQMKRSKFKFEFSSDFAYNASTQYGFTITSHKFIPYDHSDMLVIYAIRDDDEAFVFGFASGTFMFGALGPDLQYNKLKIKYNATDNSNRLFSVLSEFYLVLGMKSDIVDLVSHKLIYDATPVIAGLQYAVDNIAFHGLIGSTNMTNDTTGLSFSARPEYGIIEYRNGVLVV